jgi:uncharacterized pyridoxamine 5'-phosphate oxidase family protein
MDKVVEFLKSCGTFFYASCDGDKPRVRPFGFFMVYEGKLYFGMGKQKESFKQTIENPNFEICALNKENAWLRIRGTAVLDDRTEVLERLSSSIPSLKACTTSRLATPSATSISRTAMQKSQT